MSRTGTSIIKKDQNSFYKEGKRGYARCSIKKLHKGKVLHNCDSSPGSSGGPIICNIESKGWSYVSVNNGGKCWVDGVEKFKTCYSKYGGETYRVKNKHDRVYGSGGSFIEPFN